MNKFLMGSLCGIKEQTVSKGASSFTAWRYESPCVTDIEQHKFSCAQTEHQSQKYWTLVSLSLSDRYLHDYPCLKEKVFCLGKWDTAGVGRHTILRQEDWMWWHRILGPVQRLSLSHENREAREADLGGLIFIYETHETSCLFLLEEGYGIEQGRSISPIYVHHCERSET